MYLVMAIKQSMHIEAFGRKSEIPFSSAGFYGMCPVFEFYDDAVKFADGRAEVVEVMKSPQMEVEG